MATVARPASSLAGDGATDAAPAPRAIGITRALEPNGAVALQQWPDKASGESPPAAGAAGPAVLFSGLVTFGLSYVPAVMTASESGVPVDKQLYVPVAGPLIDLGTRPTCGPATVSCSAEIGNQALLIADGFFQGLAVVQHPRGSEHGGARKRDRDGEGRRPGQRPREARRALRGRIRARRDWQFVSSPALPVDKTRVSPYEKAAPMSQDQWTSVDGTSRGCSYRATRARSGARRRARPRAFPRSTSPRTRASSCTCWPGCTGRARSSRLAPSAATARFGWPARSPRGKVVTLEADPKHAEVARANLARAGLSQVVDVRVGRALDTLPQVAPRATALSISSSSTPTRRTSPTTSSGRSTSRARAASSSWTTSCEGRRPGRIQQGPNVQGVRRFNELSRPSPRHGHGDPDGREQGVRRLCRRAGERPARLTQRGFRRRAGDGPRRARRGTDPWMVLSDRDIELHVERVQRDGYSVVEDAIEPALIDALEKDLARIEREQHVVPAENIFEGRRTVRIYNLLARGRVYESIPVHGSVLPIVERVLDRGCLVRRSRRSPSIPERTRRSFTQMISSSRCPSPTSRSSATRCGPSRTSPRRTARHVCSPVRTGGSSPDFRGGRGHAGPRRCRAAACSSSTEASGTAEAAIRSSARRTGIAMNYCAGWMRQQENQQLGIPLDVARGFPDRLRKLCGFGIYRGLIGHIDKCSPFDLLDGGPPRPVVGVVGGRRDRSD